MSRGRDWDKAERERRAFLNGILPAWVDGWAPAGVQMPIPICSGRGTRPKVANSSDVKKNVSRATGKIVDEDDFGEWTILRLDFTDVGGHCLPSLFAYSCEAGAAVSHSNFYTTAIKYDCVGIPQSTREALLNKHHKGLMSQRVGVATFIAKKMGITQPLPEKGVMAWLRAWHATVVGFVERTLYVVALQASAASLIGVWLALKVASQWKGWSEGLKDDSKTKITGQEITGREFANVFITGTGLSLVFALAASRCIPHLGRAEWLKAIFLIIAPVIGAVALYMFICRQTNKGGS